MQHFCDKRATKNNKYIYMYIGSLCFDFSVVVERDINIGSRK